MINSREEYIHYLAVDRLAKGIARGSIWSRIKYLFYPDYVWEFQKVLRELEYYINCRRGRRFMFKRYFVMRKYNNLSIKLGFTIPPNVFGPGLSIAHYGTIVINGNTKIGANCRIHACVNIGTEAGHCNRTPTLGDNCYIGPGVKMFGDIKIGNGTIIGANAVVNRSFEESNIAIAGVPAKKIANIQPSDYITIATDMVCDGKR